MCAGGTVEQYGLVSPLILVNASFKTVPEGILCTLHIQQTLSRLTPLETFQRDFCVLSNRIAGFFLSRKSNILIGRSQILCCARFTLDTVKMTREERSCLVVFPFLKFGPTQALNTPLLLGNLVWAAAAASTLSSIFDLFIQLHTSFNLPNAPIQARIWPHREVLLPSALDI